MPGGDLARKDPAVDQPPIPCPRMFAACWGPGGVLVVVRNVLGGICSPGVLAWRDIGDERLAPASITSTTATHHLAKRPRNYEELLAKVSLVAQAHERTRLRNQARKDPLEFGLGLGWGQDIGYASRVRGTSRSSGESDGEASPIRGHASWKRSKDARAARRGADLLARVASGTAVSTRNAATRMHRDRRLGYGINLADEKEEDVDDDDNNDGRHASDDGDSSRDGNSSDDSQLNFTRCQLFPGAAVNSPLRDRPANTSPVRDRGQTSDGTRGNVPPPTPGVSSSTVSAVESFDVRAALDGLAQLPPLAEDVTDVVATLFPVQPQLQMARPTAIDMDTTSGVLMSSRKTGSTPPPQPVLPPLRTPLTAISVATVSPPRHAHGADAVDDQHYTLVNNDSPVGTSTRHAAADGEIVHDDAGAGHFKAESVRPTRADAAAAVQRLRRRIDVAKHLIGDDDVDVFHRAATRRDSDGRAASRRGSVEHALSNDASRGVVGTSRLQLANRAGLPLLTACVTLIRIDGAASLASESLAGSYLLAPKVRESSAFAPIKQSLMSYVNALPEACATNEALAAGEPCGRRAAVWAALAAATAAIADVPITSSNTDAGSTSISDTRHPLKLTPQFAAAIERDAMARTARHNATTLSDRAAAWSSLPIGASLYEKLQAHLAVVGDVITSGAAAALFTPPNDSVNTIDRQPGHGHVPDSAAFGARDPLSPSLLDVVGEHATRLHNTRLYHLCSELHRFRQWERRVDVERCSVNHRSPAGDVTQDSATAIRTRDGNGLTLLLTCPDCGNLDCACGPTSLAAAGRLVCAICDTRVAGLATMCPQCGHGGCVDCIALWFNGGAIVCATGCGCDCVAPHQREPPPAADEIAVPQHALNSGKVRAQRPIQPLDDDDAAEAALFGEPV